MSYGSIFRGGGMSSLSLSLSPSEKFSRNSADREKDPQGGDKIEIEKL